jgi:hypothetical protein
MGQVGVDILPEQEEARAFDAGTVAPLGGKGDPMRTVLLRATLAITAFTGSAMTTPGAGSHTDYAPLTGGSGEGDQH